MSNEDEVRREMEQMAKEQQCPMEDNVDAAFGPTTKGKEPKPPKYRGSAMKTGKKAPQRSDKPFHHFGTKGYKAPRK